MLFYFMFGLQGVTKSPKRKDLLRTAFPQQVIDLLQEEQPRFGILPCHVWQKGILSPGTSSFVQLRSQSVPKVTFGGYRLMFNPILSGSLFGG